MSNYTIVQSTDNVSVDDNVEGYMERPNLDAGKPPRFTLEVPDKAGVNVYKLAVGKEVKIYRNGILRMLGVIDDVTPSADSTRGRFLHVEGVSKGYKMLQDKQCDSYDYDEDGNPGTSLDAVTYNPWQYTIFRKAGGTLSATTGLEPAVDGVEFDDVAEALVGTKAIFQMDFTDNSLLLGSEIYDLRSKFQVHLDKPSGDLRPKLQRIRRNNLATGPPWGDDSLAAVHSIPFRSGDVNIDPMGAIKGMVALVVYEAGSATERLRITGTGVNIDTGTPAITNFRGSGLSAKWQALPVLTSPTEFQAAFESAATGTITTPHKIHYVKFIAYTASDTGLTFKRRLPDNLPTIGGVSGNVQIGASFQARASAGFQTQSTTAVTANRAHLRLRKVGAPTGNATIRLSTSRTSGGVSTTLNVTTICADGVAGDSGQVQEVILSDLVLQPDTDHYLTVEYSGGDGSNYIYWEYGSDTTVVHENETWNATTTLAGSFGYKVSYLPANVEDQFVETDLQGLDDRLEALERLRRLSVSDTSLSTSPHFDAWIDEDLALHWTERRGRDISTYVYSFGQGNIKQISHQFFGGRIAYQTIAFGAGSGNAQTRIVSKTAFTSGGLYDADRDWTVNPTTAIHGKTAGIRRFVDSNERSAAALFRKARADHKLHRNPIETVEVEIIPGFIDIFDVGDAVKLADIQTRTNGLQRVAQQSYQWSGNNREQIRVKLGEEPPTISDSVASTASSTGILTIRAQPRITRSASAESPIFFDKTSYGVFSFNIDENRGIKRVFFRVTTQPYVVPNGTGAAVMFKGDAPGANPVFGSRVQFAVDPPLTNGLPTDFATAQQGANFGSSTTGQSLTFDITGFLTKDANALAAEGVHQIYLLGAADTNNTNGLTCAAMDVLIEFAE